MIAFLVFLVGAGAISFVVSFYASRFLLSVLPDRKIVASLGAAFATGGALIVFYLLAAALIDVKAPSPGMGGLAWMLQIISYGVTVILIVPCLIVGIAKGLKPPAG